MIRKFLTIIVAATFFINSAQAQNKNIIGEVEDATDKSKVPGATIGLLSVADSSTIQTAVSNNKGAFVFSDVAQGDYLITISTAAFDQKVIRTTVGTDNKYVGSILLNRKSKDLDAIVIISKAPAAAVKGDTTEFGASHYKVNPDATIEDLIKKMPGIVVDKNGKVTAGGEEVKKVTIDGKDFFGADASVALKNLPSEAVDKIQVYDRLSDKAQLTGVDDGNSVKAINVVTKAGYKNGQFGRLYAGAGTDNRYAAGGNMSIFNGDQRFSAVANFNNVNQQNFGSQDLLGVTGQGGGRSGGGRGRGGGEDFNVGQTNGISKTNAIGLNYSDQWTPKLKVSASYFFNNSKTNNDNFTNTQTFADPKDIFSLQSSSSATDNTNHRLNARLEYKIDDKNTLTIIPNLSFQKNKYNSYTDLKTFYSEGDSLNTYKGLYSSDRNGYNFGNTLQYQHAFNKKGRSLSVNLETQFNNNDGNSITNGDYRFFNLNSISDSAQNQTSVSNTNGNRYDFEVSYSEPIGKKGQIELKLNPQISKNKADQQTFASDGQKYTIFDTTLSNKFDNITREYGGGLSYRYIDGRDKMIVFGANYKNTELESQRIFPTQTSVRQSFNNILPYAFSRLKIGKYNNVRLFYRAYNSTPSVSQLQDVINVSNPLRVSSGNPDLKQATGTYLGTRYSYTNTRNSRNVFVNAFIQTSNNYVSNATFIAKQDSTIQNGIVLKRGSQITKPVNLDGFQNLRTSVTYSMPLKFIKTNINLTGGYNYNRLPGLVNNRSTLTKNNTYTGGIVFASNISTYIDFNLNYNVNYNEARTTGGSTNSTNYTQQSAGFQLNLLDKKGWFLQNDVNNQTYSGLSGGLNQSYWLWNAALGKKFLKNQVGELKLSVFDLLKQNQAINRTVTNAYIEDTRNTVLQQYFMLTFTYSLKNFGSKKEASASNDENGGRRHM